MPVLLSQLGGVVLPRLGNAPRLDIDLLGIGVALARCRDEAGIKIWPDIGRFPATRTA
jgi:hypothetical protein